MKVAFTHESKNRNLATLHFPCELPILVPVLRSHAWAPRRPWLLSRSTRLASFAACLSRVNRGRFFIELPSPTKTFQEFAEELVVLEGFIRLYDGSRYTLTIEAGRCFPIRSVCQAVAEVVCRHFYPAKTVRVEVGAG